MKASHDGGVAVLDGARLLFSFEVEKIDNSPRYSPLGHLERVGELLHGQGVDIDDVGQIVVDGWWDEADVGHPSVRSAYRGEEFVLPVADYLSRGRGSRPLDRATFDVPVFGGHRSYSSYSHTAGHVMAAYCTSTFAAAGEPSLVLAWDGGITPQLYLVDPQERTVKLIAPLLSAIGNIYPHLCGAFGPFGLEPSLIDGDPVRQRRQLEVSGKAMAYAALGRSEPAAFDALDTLFSQTPAVSDRACVELARTMLRERAARFPGMGDADMIATIQDYLGQRLLENLRRTVLRRFGHNRPNLCVGGGCALNIKWNSSVRASGLFADVWVPPFPNDAGAAIGAAATEWFTQHGGTAVSWSVFSGPPLASSAPLAGWSKQACSTDDVADLLHTSGEPVVVLDGRAELGPRALGNRSILAPAVDPAMKDRLNEIKGRAGYRPVAPICLASHSDRVFEPGGSDPYMLFDHRPRPDWANRIPAVVHLDGTARLQTIDDDATTAAAGILRAYERRSGIPVLCNTSANLNGSGFFPDAASAMSWGRVRHVWAEGVLFSAEPAAPVANEAVASS